MTNFQDRDAEVFWVSKSDQFPDTCCSCGMFTYDRVTVKHVDLMTKTGGAGGASIFLSVILHIFLGPIGWLFTMLVEGDESQTKIVKKKSKLRMPHCQVCQINGAPEVVDSAGNRFAFIVHPKFKTRYLELQRALAEEAER